MDQKKWINLSLVLGVICLAVLLFLWFGQRQNEPIQGPEKEITVLITHGDGETVEKTFVTRMESLGGALEEQELIVGEEGPYGVFIHTVDGETIDEDAQEWWCLTKGGEAVMTGADQTAIAHGDQFELTSTVGY